MRHAASNSYLPKNAPSFSRHFQGAFLNGGYPGFHPGLKPVETLGFYEAELVKTRCKKTFLLILVSIWLGHGNNKPPWLWCSIFAVRGTSIARIERQSQLRSPARKNIGSSEQRNKWKGPVWQLQRSCQTGRRPFMPDATLNQCSCAAGSVFIG